MLVRLENETLRIMRRSNPHDAQDPPSRKVFDPSGDLAKMLIIIQV